MTMMASQITSLTVVYSVVYLGPDRKTPNLRVTGLCAGNSPGSVNPPHKEPVTRKMFPFDDVTMPLAYKSKSPDTNSIAPARQYCARSWHECVCISYAAITVSPVDISSNVAGKAYLPLFIFNIYCNMIDKLYFGSPVTLINALRPRQDCRHFPDDIFNCIFFNENAWISFKISLKFVPKVQINNITALVQIMAWCRPGHKPLSDTNDS